MSNWVMIVVVGLGVSVAPALGQQPPAEAPRAVLPREAPAGYPRDASLDDINKWLWEEYFRQAAEAHRKAMVGVKMQPGSCGGSYGVSVTPEALPLSEWLALARRTTDAMTSKDPAVRLEGMRFVYHLQQAAFSGNLPEILDPKLRDATVRLMNDPDPEVRRLAIGVQVSLFEVGGTDRRAAIAAALDAVPSEDTLTRRQAVQTLEHLALDSNPETNAYGDLAPKIIDRVLPLASDPDRMTRMQAILVIARTGEHAKPLMPRFAAWLRGGDKLSRRTVCRAVESLGGNAAPLMPQLVAAALDRSNEERTGAIRAIGHSATSSPEAIAALLSIAQEEEGINPGLARSSLAMLGSKAAAAAPKLRAFGKSHPEAAKECCWAADIIDGKRKITDPPE